jgi:hypothetical protein
MTVVKSLHSGDPDVILWIILKTVSPIQYIIGVVPAIRVLSLAWAPRGFHRAMFMNSVSHGKVWAKNTASSFYKPCLSKNWMLGGYLCKDLSFSPPPHPPTSPS